MTDKTDTTVRPFPTDRVRQMLDAAPVEREEAPKPRLSLEWFEDIEPALDVPELVEGLLTPAGASVVYGASNCGKTFFASDLAFHVALGLPWRDRHVEQGAVIYVAAEGGFGIRNRIAAFRKHHEITERVPFALLASNVNMLDPEADTEPLMQMIEQAAARAGMPVRLVVLDTLARVMAGGDENSGADMGRLVANIDRIRSATGAHVMLIHHSGKDAAKGARGHSSLRAAVDTEIEVTKDDVTDVACASVVKQRDLEKAGEFSFKLQSVTLGTNPRGKWVTSCVVEPTEGGGQRGTKPKLSPLERNAMLQLTNTIIDEGKRYPGRGDIPGTVDIVPLEAWKARLVKAHVLSGDNEGTAKKQWQRIRQGLQDKGILRIWGDLCWMGGQEGTTGGQTQNVHPGHDEQG